MGSYDDYLNPSRSINGDDEGLSTDEIGEKIEEYSTFVEKILYPQLKHVVSLREETERDIHEYEELKCEITHLLRKLVIASSNSSSCSNSREREKNNNITDLSDKVQQTSLNKERKVLVDMGHQTVYCRATIPNPSTIFVHVSMGFHVEFGLDEALAFADRKIEYLNENVLLGRAKRAREVASHIEEALRVLEKLTNLISITDNTTTNT